MDFSEKEMPHLGAMLKKYMAEHRFTNTECAQKMGVHPSQVTKFLENYTMQMDTFWKFCVALDHDFLSDLLPHLSVYRGPAEDPRLKEMQMQIDIYREILKVKEH